MGALLVYATKYPTRTTFLLDARTLIHLYGLDRERSESGRAARCLLDVSRDPTCIPGYKLERDETTSKFRIRVTRILPPGFASAAQ